MASAEATCGWCERPFRTEGRAQLIAFNKGHSVYCSDTCAYASAMRKQRERTTHLCGPCPTCKREFRARTAGKQFCSIACYVASDDVKARLADANAARRLPDTQCLHCGKLRHNRNAIRKFCSKACRRAYFASRFDRWVADPQQLALPQCYDEFLGQEELPCLVDGCEWRGERLAWHCNIAHGIQAADLKRLAGFNKTTGLVPPDVQQRMAERMARQIAEGNLVSAPGTLAHPPGPRPEGYYHSLEAKEHHAKAMAVAEVMNPPKAPLPCRGCDAQVPQRLTGKQFYCSPACRDAHYARQGKQALRCDFCGREFTGNRTQALRAARGQKVCCSLDCRNNMNIAACLSATGRGHDPREPRP